MTDTTKEWVLLLQILNVFLADFSEEWKGQDTMNEGVPGELPIFNLFEY